MAWAPERGMEPMDDRARPHPPQIRPRAEAFAGLEAGHVAQNILRQAAARGLAAVPVGSLDPFRAAAALDLAPDQAVIYLIRSASPHEDTSRRPGTETTARSGKEISKSSRTGRGVTVPGRPGADGQEQGRRARGLRDLFLLALVLPDHDRLTSKGLIFAAVAVGLGLLARRFGSKMQNIDGGKVRGDA